MQTAHVGEHEENQPEHFVGRARELGLLRSGVVDKSPGQPALSIVEGRDGLGKTALLHQLTSELNDHFVCFVDTNGLSHDQPFSLVNRLIEELRPYDPVTAAMRMAHTVESPHVVGGRLLAGLSHLEQLRPVVLILDDADRIDTESLRTLSFLIRRLWHHKISVVASTRPVNGEPGRVDWRAMFSARDRHCEVFLSGFSVTEIQELATRSGMPELTSRELQVIQYRSEGEPHQVARLLAGLLRDPHIRLSASPPVPRSVAETTLELLADLPEGSRELLNAIAVLDTRSPLAVGAFTADVADPVTALEPLIEAGLARWWPREPTSPVMITSPLRRETIYHSLDPDTRRRLHTRAALALGTEESFLHRAKAAEGTGDEALTAELVEAAHRWIANGYLERAANYLLWAADVQAPRPSSEPHLLLAVSLLQRQNQFDRATALQSRVRACEPSALRNCVEGRQALQNGDAATALELLRSAAEAVEADPGTPNAETVRSFANTWLVAVHSWVGEPYEARQAARRAMNAPFGPGVDRGIELVYVYTFVNTDGPAVAWRKLHELAELPEHPSAADPRDSALLLLRGGLAYMLGSPATAIDDLTAALRAGCYAGTNDMDEFAHLWIAMSQYALGAWEPAADAISEAASLAVTEARITGDIMFGMSAFLAAQRGDVALATEHATTCTSMVENLGLSSNLVFPALGWAAIAQAQSDPAAMVQALAPIADRAAESTHTRNQEWLWRPMLIEGLLGEGRFLDAADELRALEQRVGEGYRMGGLAHSWLSGRVAEATGDIGAAREWYAKAIAAPSHAGLALHRARAHESYGALLSRAAEKEAGARHFLTALASYRAMGARPFLRQAKALAADIGVDNRAPRGIPLTARERSVAELAASGLSNEEMASQLGVSVKTVEAHLTKVYAKLSINSRQNLAEKLENGK